MRAFASPDAATVTGLGSEYASTHGPAVAEEGDGAIELARGVLQRRPRSLRTWASQAPLGMRRSDDSEIGSATSEPVGSGQRYEVGAGLLDVVLHVVVEQFGRLIDGGLGSLAHVHPAVPCSAVEGDERSDLGDAGARGDARVVLDDRERVPDGEHAVAEIRREVGRFRKRVQGRQPEVVR